MDPRLRRGASLTAAAQKRDYTLKQDEIIIRPPSLGRLEKIFWRHNGEKVATFDGSKQHFYGSYDDRTIVDRLSATLWIREVRLEDRGEYELEVWVKDQNHQTKKEYHRWEVTAEVSITSVSCEMDGDHQAKLVCSAESSHPQLLNYEWSFNGTKHRGSNLTIGLEEEHDETVFTCRVSSPLSEDKATLAARKCYPETPESVVPTVVPIVAVLMVAVLLIVGLVVWKRRKGSPEEENQAREEHPLMKWPPDSVDQGSRAAECGGRLKRRLKEQFHSVSEGVARAGNSAPLNQIYTALYITEGGTEQVNQEHEVRQIEAATRQQTRAGTTISPEDLFKASADTERPIRSLLTKGVAGIGKTLLTQKLTLDWAEDKAHQNFQLVFPFTFRELNRLKKKKRRREEKLSLMELVHHFFPEAKDSGLCSFEGVQVLFILDGLDECRLPLDFNSRVLTAATESTSVDVLLTNLIRGNLLPSAQLWITTRPAAANQIPPTRVDRVTEVRGFTDLQKEEYFRKRFRDEQQSTIMSHIRSSRSLHIMCHIPIFCWITATVLEDMLKSRETRELPKTLTEMYIHFLVVQAKVKQLKYHGGAGTDEVWTPESRKMMESLGKLAFEQLQRGNLIFYESDLTECGIDITAAAVYSGVFTQIFREERGLYQHKVFCFVHLSLQEFLAALHVHLKFFNSGVNLLGSLLTSTLSRIFRKNFHPEQFYQRAINEAVESPNGHLDLFLRFLLGLSLQTNQRLLPGLLTQTGSSSWTHQDTAEFIRKKISEKVSPERIFNLFHCLSELKVTSLVEEVNQLLRSGVLSTAQLSPAQWSTLAFILLSSEEDLDVFDLEKYYASEKVLERLLPVVQAAKEARLIYCGLSERSGSLLSSVLSSPSSSLTQLDLSQNWDLKDAGVELLSAGLKSPHCHLETLSLRRCELSERSGSLLSSVLSSPSSSLTQLDLSGNINLKDAGVELLSAGLKSPHCHLETLSLIDCGLSERSGSLLSSVLSSPSSSLTQLDLSYNWDLKDAGVELLSAGLKSPHCHLETLRLRGCRISESGCASLASALTSNPSHLRELDLSSNHPGGAGLELLSAGLESPDWRLETLRL
ncbi:NLR family CARD domain-containing protein 3-like [Synchiropus splendidus]|uniref:NLR family CARD domain-containing protein 3-like n=1 Tax=Synchiropus splendidus TaxID=270530 RepID=UPI00237E9C26|nr:NLR family CARD domain-containing protein 3-like [Synchiropus splendidus]XP_053723775.1 NLR family CARD domain-containing protein 3-like [Synchiropus splendidus]